MKQVTDIEYLADIVYIHSFECTSWSHMLEKLLILKACHPDEKEHHSK